MTYWKQASVISAIVFVLAFAMAAAMAGDPPAGGQAQGCPHTQPGPHGRSAGGEARVGEGKGRLGGGGPLGIAPGRGYIEPNAETKALWERLGKIQADLHAAQWDLFVLMAQKPRDQQKIKAQEQKIKQLRESMRSVWEKLRSHWRTVESRSGGQTGRGRGQAGHKGGGRKAGG